MKNKVVLVDVNDKVLGLAEKLEAHRNGGQLHRAFSLFIFNSRGEMLIHQRASTKYHCPNLWTNACCSHPDLNTSLEDFARNRLDEEMGLSCAEISREFSFIYRHEFENGLTEHELDYVLTAFSDETPVVNPEEVSDFKWVKISDLYQEINENPAKFTPWFKIICVDKRFQKILKKFS